jgi:pyridinium-3,5-bisthiocarboxylic acid mononucleotide nickel chelatase
VILYIDCVGGVAGDMLLGALLDAGADVGEVRQALAATGIDGLDLELERVERHGISATHVDVVAPPEHVHRTWREVREIVESASLSAWAEARALDAFRRLAMAEGLIHRVPPEEVQFHEVGSLDAIGDVIGVCVAAASLGADEIACSPLPTSRGFVRAAHGHLPLPAPATLEILREAGAPLVPLEVGVELVTPTGAALVAALATTFGPYPTMVPMQIGYGAGTRDPVEVPNLLRVVLGDAPVPSLGRTSPVYLIEANLDDLSPELVPDAAAAATSAGALDVWTVPAQMKKGRPGFVLCALARPPEREAVAASLLRHTSTLGVRIARYDRHELERDWITVEVAGGPVRVKRGWLDGEVVNLAPEHDDCAALAARIGRPVQTVWASALAAADRGEGHGHDHHE